MQLLEGDAWIACEQIDLEVLELEDAPFEMILSAIEAHSEQD